MGRYFVLLASYTCSFSRYIVEVQVIQGWSLGREDSKPCEIFDMLAEDKLSCQKAREIAHTKEIASI